MLWGYLVGVLLCKILDNQGKPFLHQTQHLKLHQPLLPLHIPIPIDHKPLAHRLNNLRLHHLLFLLIFGLRTRHNMTRFILTKTIRYNSTIRLRLLFFILLLDHFLVYTIGHQLRVLVTAVIVSDVLGLLVWVREVYFRLFYGEVVELQAAAQHVYCYVAGFCHCLHSLFLKHEL